MNERIAGLRQLHTRWMQEVSGPSKQVLADITLLIEKGATDDDELDRIHQLAWSLVESAQALASDLMVLD